MSLPNLIDIATDERQTEDDWTKILDVCEKGSSNPKECLKLILRRMFNRNPHVVLRSIILLDACVQNIGESFAKEISSRYFVTEIKSKSKTMHQKALERLCFMMKKWSRELSGKEFDFIIELNKWLQDTYPNCYAAGDDELNSRNTAKHTRKVVVGQEEADIAKAIALSLKETESKRTTLYPSTTNNVISDIMVQPKKSMTKVRALYDFEAAEENELTFKAGEIIIDVDTSNEHWWTGSNHRGEGMFPAQFVTLDLGVQVDKSVEQFAEKNGAQSSLQSDHFLARPPTPVIDESRIDDCIRLIEDADPTGEMKPDPAELAKYEAQCRLMGPLIDQELEKVDRRYNRLADINRTIVDSFQMYNELMTQGGVMRPANYMWPQPMPQQYFGMAQDPSQGMPPRLSQQMNSMPQQQQQQPQPQFEPMRFPAMNYYGGPGSMPNELRGNQASGGYQMPPHMSLDTDRVNYPPSSNNNVVVAEMAPSNNDTIPNVIAFSVHNNFAPANYPYSATGAVEPNISYVQK